MLQNFFGFGNPFRFQAPQQFNQIYNAYSFIYSQRSASAEELNNGGKIFLPQTALEVLSQLRIAYPMIFQIKNWNDSNKVTHCGVLEFTAEEGKCYMPYWMMKQLGLDEGGCITITNVTLPPGQFVKIRPHKTEFTEINNPRAVLEKSLRNYTTLTEGDTIIVPYNNKEYAIDILEIQPPNPFRAINITETDVQVEFSAPLDYVEPSRIQPVAPTPAQENKEEAKEEVKEEENTFKPFTGTYHTLSGRPPKKQPSTNAVNIPAKSPAPTTQVQASKSPTSDVVFATRTSLRNSSDNPPSLTSSGSNPSVSKRRKRGESIEEFNKKQQPEENKPTFVPFSGTGYTLKQTAKKN